MDVRSTPSLPQQDSSSRLCLQRHKRRKCPVAEPFDLFPEDRRTEGDEAYISDVPTWAPLGSRVFRRLRRRFRSLDLDGYRGLGKRLKAGQQLVDKARVDIEDLEKRIKDFDESRPKPVDLGVARDASARTPIGGSSE